MRRVGLRILSVVLAGAALAVYAGAAYLAAEFVASLWAARSGVLGIVAVTAGLTVVISYVSYRFGTLQLLARLEATEIPRRRAPEIHRRFDRLCGSMSVARPTLSVARLAVPNALALGGAGRGVVVLDRSLFRLLNADELEAILAHELAHLESRDALVQTMAYGLGQSLVWPIVIVSLPVVLLAVGASRARTWLSGRPADRASAPLAEFHRRVGQAVGLFLSVLTLLLLAHSRRREFAADDRAAAVTDDPRALASALRKIERASRPRRGPLTPLYVRGDEEGWLTERLSTHPATDERIRRLQARADERWTRIEIR